MSFEFWGFTQSAFLRPPEGYFGYSLVFCYAALGLFALAANLRALSRLKLAHWLALLGLMFAGLLLAQLFILRFPANILPPPGLPVEASRPGLAPFVLLPAF